MINYDNRRNNGNVNVDSSKDLFNKKGMINMETIKCKYHGIQNAIGNNDECEMCLIEYNQQQEHDFNNEYFYDSH